MHWVKKVAVQASQVLLITRRVVCRGYILQNSQDAQMAPSPKIVCLQGGQHLLHAERCAIGRTQHSTAQHSTAQHSTAQHSSFKTKHDIVDNRRCKGCETSTCGVSLEHTWLHKIPADLPHQSYTHQCPCSPMHTIHVVR